MSARPATASAYPTRSARRLAQYLRAQAHRADGALHVTPDALAAEVGLPRDDVQALLVRFRDTVPGLTLEARSSAPAPTWRVAVP